MRYIDEDLQNIYRRTLRKLQQSDPNNKQQQKYPQLPTTPFTASELQTLSLNNSVSLGGGGGGNEKRKDTTVGSASYNKLLVSAQLFSSINSLY